MKKTIYLPFILFAAITLVFSSCQEEEISKKDELDISIKDEKKKKPPVGKTHLLTQGDKFVFQVIPSFTEEPVPAFYYEEITGRTYTTPLGEQVYLNSLGNVGEPGGVYFAYKQDKKRNILFYGTVVPHPADPSIIVHEEWITNPESGFILNYPGTYFIGQRWNQKFEMKDLQGNVTANVDISYVVGAYEQVEVPVGSYGAYKILAFDNTTRTQESVSWFAPELGINIKKYSYNQLKPGYQLSDYYFATK